MRPGGRGLIFFSYFNNCERSLSFLNYEFLMYDIFGKSGRKCELRILNGFSEKNPQNKKVQKKGEKRKQLHLSVSLFSAT